MKLPFSRRLVALLLSMGALSPAAHANMTIYPMRVALQTDKPAEMRVYSKSAQPQFVKITLKEIVDPATAQEQEIDVSSGARAPLLLSPGKFALPGGGNRVVRVIPLLDVEKETAYRAYFEAVKGDEPSTLDAPVEGADASVSVNLVWGTLISLLPRDGVAAMALRGDALHNTGTLKLGLLGVAECTGTVCTPHELSRSLYPGQQLKLPFTPRAGQRIELRYRLTADGFKEHTHTLAP